MKQIDFDHGTVTGNILGAALPMLVAQILSLLYNIVDRFILPGSLSRNNSAWSSGFVLSDYCDHSLHSAIYLEVAVPVIFN